MEKLTIYDIKYQTQETEPYFFDRKTLKFFGQTMKDFSVRKSPTGRIFIYAPMYYSSHPGSYRLCGYTFREYVDNKLVTPRTDQDQMAEHDNLAQIYDYIASH